MIVSFALWLSAIVSAPSPTKVQPGIISTEQTESSLTISPDSTELFFVRSTSFYTPSKKVIYHSRKVNGVWTTPQIASFSGRYSDNSPFITYDGQWLYFASRRPVNGKEKQDNDLWRVRKVDGRWGEPEHLGATINSSKSDYSPSLDRQGNLYFGSTRDSLSWGNIFVSRYENGIYQETKALPAPINTDGGEWGSCISPDGNWLVFEASGRAQNLSNDGDLYLAHKDEKGHWTQLEHLPFNSMMSDLAPRFFPDDKSEDRAHLFFSSNRNDKDQDSDDVDIYQLSLKLPIHAKR